MIETHELTKYYGPKRAIEEVSFRVEKGEILGFLGPNAAGKTTTMRILTCYLSPSSGSATVAGYDIFDHPIEVRRKIGYLPESVPLYPEMRVAQYLEFVAWVKGITSRDERRKQIAEVLDNCGLSDVQGRIVGNLSKGYKQRVGLAQALIGKPEVLILDEPTVGLDPKQIIEIRNLIRSLGGTRTIILSTHILHEVEMTCGRVVIIHQGQIVAQDTPENLTKRLQGAARVQVVVDGGSPEKVRGLLSAIPGADRVELQGAPTNGTSRFIVESAPDKDLRPLIAQVLVQNRLSLLELRSQELTLEEIFIQTVSQEAEARA